MKLQAFVLGLALLACDRASEVQPESPSDTAPATPWLKVQLHAHSSNSGDSQTPPEQVAAWYEAHNFDVVVLTDHNVITELEHPGDMLVLPGVELTLNLRACDPPPEPGLACLLHMNALLVEPAGVDARRVHLDTSATDRFTLYQGSLEKGSALGGLVMLNHPNFHFAADAVLLDRLAGEGLRFLEVANEASDSNNAPQGRPSTEDLWDALLRKGHRIWGVATDDAHHYQDAERVAARGEEVFVGDRGFVMVRAEKNPAAIRAALEAGDFYASNGLLLAELVRTSETLSLRVSGTEDALIRFVGRDGELARHTGLEASFDVGGLPADGYVRAVIERDGRRAWTQPAWP